MSYNRSRSRSPYRARPEGGERREPRSDFRRDRPDRRRDRSPAKPSRVLGVFGLSYGTAEDTLRDLFKDFGEIERLVILTDKVTGNSRGFGFITFESVEIATDAKEKTNGLELDGRTIRVDYSMSDKPREPREGGAPREGGERRFERRPYDRDSRPERRREPREDRY